MLSIAPLEIGLALTTSYDLFFAVAGFEARARDIPVLLGKRVKKGVAIGFTENECLSFEENIKAYLKLGYCIARVTDAEFPGLIRGLLEELLAEAGSAAAPLVIGVDISSYSRLRMAVILECLVDLDRACSVYFLYSLAKYSPPPQDLSPNVHVGPVTDRFAGWTSDPSRSVWAILGLGYEQDRALGALEHIETGTAWLMFPESPIKAYGRAVATTNRLLISLVPERNLIPYRVQDPFHAFGLVDALVRTANPKPGCIVFPFGPKIFALISMLVSLLREGTAVWRVSPGQNAIAVDREPSGLRVGIMLRLSKA